MATAETPVEKKVAVKEMSWDPVTRIVGSLGIHTEIDFANQQVLKCYSTSMIFRGFDIFMKGIDPRDAHFITSRICGICGDNHCTCSCLNQNMAYGVKPPPLGDYAFNLAESADFMFDHAIFNDCMANVDYSEQVVKETNPGLLKKAEETSAPHSDIHGYKTIADIMRALNAFTGSFYLETLQVARYTREMYCLFGGRHTHPSTIMPGGCSADITHQTLTDYYVRLMRYMDYCKRTVPMHDDLYDFFYEALPGYEKVGYRDTDLVCWGAFDDPQYVDYSYKNMTEWGRHRFVTPGLVFKGELITTDLVEINLAIRILLGSSYFDDWTNEETFVTQDPLGNPVDKRHPWNKVTLPKPQARDWADKYSWVASPRMFDKRNDIFVANDTGGGPFARQWVTAKAGLVDIGYLKATGESLQMVLPKTGFMPEMELEWKIPQWSQRDRAPARAQLPPGVLGARRALQPRAGAQGGPRRPHEVVERLQGARVGRQRRLPRGGARRALAPHGHPRGQDRQLPAVPADAVERQPARRPRHARPVRGRGAEHADLRGERSRELQGDRHHAGGPQLRPVPAMRRAHVREGQGPQGRPHADGDVLTSDQLIARVQELTAQLEEVQDFQARAVADELVASIMQLYGEGLERIIAARSTSRRARSARRGRRRREPAADPRPVSGVARDARAARRSSSVRPYMESHGGDVELLGVEDGVAQMRLVGHCEGCPASEATLELAIKKALEETAPDLEGLEVEGVSTGRRSSCR